MQGPADQPHQGMPGTLPPKKGHKVLWIVLVSVLGVAVLCAGGLITLGLIVGPSKPTAAPSELTPSRAAPQVAASPAVSTAAPNPAASTPAPPSKAVSHPVPADRGGDIPPVPDASKTAAYLAALEDINPEILEGGPSDALVARGRDQCTDIKQRPKSTWAWWADQRFNSPEHPDGFGQPTADRIIAVARKYICPGY